MASPMRRSLSGSGGPYQGLGAGGPMGSLQRNSTSTGSAAVLNLLGHAMSNRMSSDGINLQQQHSAPGAMPGPGQQQGSGSVAPSSPKPVSPGAGGDEAIASAAAAAVQGQGLPAPLQIPGGGTSEEAAHKDKDAHVAGSPGGALVPLGSNLAGPSHQQALMQRQHSHAHGSQIQPQQPHQMASGSQVHGYGAQHSCPTCGRHPCPTCGQPVGAGGGLSIHPGGPAYGSLTSPQSDPPQLGSGPGAGPAGSLLLVHAPAQQFPAGTAGGAAGSSLLGSMGLSVAKQHWKPVGRTSRGYGHGARGGGGGNITTMSMAPQGAGGSLATSSIPVANFGEGYGIWG